MLNAKSALLATTTALLGLLTVGCGDKPVAKPSTAKDRLEEIGQMLKTLSAEKTPPPSKAADLASVEPMIPQAMEDLKSGEIVYFWGNGLTGGDAIIAHEKNAPSAGGWVLLQDGTVKQMSASEFGSAKKAKK